MTYAIRAIQTPFRLALYAINQLSSLSGLTLAALLLAGLLPYRSALADDALPVVSVANGIYLHQGVHEMMSENNLGEIGNSGFIIGDESVVVIDPGGSLEAGRLFRQAIENVTDLPINYLVLTHFHPDHVSGAMAFADVRNVIAHEKYAGALAQRAQFYLDRFPELLPGNVAQVFRLPTQTIPEGQSVDIDLGDRLLSIEAYPLAHTDNDLTVHDLQTNTLWASDLVFAQRTPALDGSLPGWLQVLSMLEERSYSLVVPGHGSPGLWSELVPPQQLYLELLRDEVRGFIDEGKSLAQVLEQHEERSGNTGQWQLYQDQHGTNLAKSYSELEWE